MTTKYVSYDDLLSVMSLETLDTLPILDIGILQRYNTDNEASIGMSPYYEGDWIKYGDLKEGMIV